MSKLTADQRRALETLAGSPNGYADSVMFAFGIKPDVLAELLIGKLAMSEVDRMMDGGKAVDFWRVHITDGGRVPLER